MTILEFLFLFVLLFLTTFSKEEVGQAQNQTQTCQYVTEANQDYFNGVQLECLNLFRNGIPVKEPADFCTLGHAYLKCIDEKLQTIDNCTECVQISIWEEIDVQLDEPLPTFLQCQSLLEYVNLKKTLEKERCAVNNSTSN
ncbi:hypothetical protein Ddc_12560 [Ditylenchus destructor]|nr:hypothetical protein Ddc_12560 [Ditylenchus destructor]